MTIALPNAAPRVVPAAGADLEHVAGRFASLARDEAEAMIEANVALAITQWRIADATFWQRVRFRSRMIRAVRDR